MLHCPRMKAKTVTSAKNRTEPSVRAASHQVCWTNPEDRHSCVLVIKSWSLVIVGLGKALCIKLVRSVLSYATLVSDDTGCPSSQCPSPAKIRSGSDNSSSGSPVPVKSKAKVKRVRVSVVAECNGIMQKPKREQQQPSILHRGNWQHGGFGKVWKILLSNVV